MNSAANIAAHVSIGPKVNCQQNLTGSVELLFTSIWWITVAMLVIWLWKGVFDLKYLIPVKKV